MDNRPIGFFDSGLGGLTSIMCLKDIMPNEKVLFYGDTARTPYGSKSPDTIRDFSKQIVEYLISMNVKLIVIACNTATSMALEMLREEFKDIPIIGVIEPTVRKVAKDSRKSVGIIGTKATINSDIYNATLRKYNPGIKTNSLACPAFVPLIEEGIVDNMIMDLTIKYYMDDFVKNGDFDSLILGCTHYPLIALKTSSFSIYSSFTVTKLFISFLSCILSVTDMAHISLSGPEMNCFLSGFLEYTISPVEIDITAKDSALISGSFTSECLVTPFCFFFTGFFDLAP